MTYRVKNDNFNEFLTTHPNMDTLSHDIINNPNFEYLAVSDSTKRDPQWFVTYYTEDGTKVQQTENQSVQLLMIYMGLELDKAETGLKDWNGRRALNINDEHTRNFYRTVRGFFPENSDAAIVKDAFFHRCIKGSEGWRDDNRNFLNSKLAESILYMPTTRRYEKQGVGKNEYTEEEAAELNDLYYKEEIAAHGNKMNTAIDRQIVCEKAAMRLFEETGYVYTMTTFDIDDAWIDKNAIEIAKRLVPDFWDALQEVCAMIEPNSIAAYQILKSEDISPLAQTRQYKKSMKRGFLNFCDMFHLREEDFANKPKGFSDDKFIVNQIDEVVFDINRERGVEYSQEEIDRIVYSIAAYYEVRKERIAIL